MPEGGCQTATPTEWIDNIFDYVCPVVYLHEYHQVFEAFEWFTIDKVLPYGGGRLEQPFLIMEYITLIRSVVNGRK
jgi:hypothetical protein